MADEKDLTELETQKINLETAQIKWSELQRYFAAGRVVHINAELDLINVALQFTLDNSEKVNQWKQSGKIEFVNDEQAKQWLADDTNLWAVVIKPWVLVQDRDVSKK